MYKHFQIMLSMAFSISITVMINAQTYTDYFGNGHEGALIKYNLQQMSVITKFLLMTTLLLSVY